MKKPNIIVYLSDQQRADTMGCYGQKLPVTPTTDQLAREGVLFENAFTCQPVCGPARSCISTGKFPTTTGSYVNHIGLREDENTIAKELREGGYETAYIGKWHLACDILNDLHLETTYIPPERMGGYEYYFAVDALELTSHGYDGFIFDHTGKKHEFIGYRADAIMDYAIHYLHNRPSEKPFFLFISPIEPHQQNDRDCYEGPDGSRTRFGDYEVPADLLNGKYEGDWKQNYPDYLGCCRSLDDNLAKLITTLKEQNIYDDTVIIYTSDHGNHFRTQDGEYKRNCFDSCLKIPMIAAGGPFKGGIRNEEIVSLINLPATILDLAGVEPPEDWSYPSLREAVEGDGQWAKEMFFQVSETELGRGIRNAKWKYYVHAPHVQPLLHMDSHFTSESYYDMLYNSRPDSDSYLEKCLFDLENDPFEKNNLVGDPKFADTREILAETLKRCMVQAGEKAPEIYPHDHPIESLRPAASQRTSAANETR